MNYKPIIITIALVGAGTAVLLALTVWLALTPPTAPPPRAAVATPTPDPLLYAPWPDDAPAARGPMPTIDWHSHTPEDDLIMSVITHDGSSPAPDQYKPFDTPLPWRADHD